MTAVQVIAAATKTGTSTWQSNSQHSTRMHKVGIGN